MSENQVLRTGDAMLTEMLCTAGKGFALPCQQQRVFDHYIPGPFHRSTAVTRNCSAVPSRLANAAFVRKSSTSSGVRSRPLSLKKSRQALQMNVMWSSGFAECRKQGPRPCETQATINVKSSGNNYRRKNREPKEEGRWPFYRRAGGAIPEATMAPSYS